MAICFADIRPCFTAYALCINLTAKTGSDAPGGIAFFILDAELAIFYHPDQPNTYDA